MARKLKLPLRIALLFGMLLALLLAFASCGKLTLSRPTKVYIDSDTLILHWAEVDGADRYVVSVGGNEYETNKTEYSLTSLSAGEYTVRVMARDKDKEYKDSEWSASASFTREEENGLRYRLINSKTEYEVYGKGSASGDIVIPETYRGKKVTQIAAKAFSSESKLTSIEIGSNVKTIGDRAFYMCSYLTSVKFNGTITSIGLNVFQSCSRLTSIELPEGITYIGTNAFAYCKSLESISLPSTLLSIGNTAFLNCAALTSVTIPAATESIGEGCFKTCTALTSVDLGGVKSVGAEAFFGDTALTTIDFSAVEEIAASAFSGCMVLQEISIPDSTTTIYEKAFYGCTALDTVSLGKNITKVGYGAFTGTKLWTDATDLVYADRWCVGLKSSSASDKQVTSLRIEAPSVSTSAVYAVWKSDVVGIADEAFYRNSYLATVQFPGRLRYIGDYAFAACTALQQVQINSAMEIINRYAFASCDKLQSIVMPTDGASLKKIDSFAFMACTKLTQIVNDLPDSLEEIGTQAFYNTGLWSSSSSTNGIVYSPDGKWVFGVSGTITAANIREGVVGVSKYAFSGSDIQSVSFPISMKYVNYAAFYGCESLASVDFSDCSDIQTIGQYAFYKCKSLKSAVLPATLKTIERSTFSGCDSLTSVTSVNSQGTAQNSLPTTLTSIGDYAFSNCTALTSITMPASLRTIGDYAFQGCGFVNLVLGENVESVGNRAFRNNVALVSVDLGQLLTEVGPRAFYNCTELKTVIFSDETKSIGAYAFYGCTALATVEFNDRLETIGKYAFLGCTSILKLDFPSSLTTIEDYAFRGCTNLQGVILPDTLTTIGKHVFFGCNLLTIYAEADSLPEGYAAMWNSSYRPVVWGASLSGDRTYVVSVVKTENSVSYATAKNPVGVPLRPGYEFKGWTSVQGGTEVEYLSYEIVSDTIADGTTLYAVWGDPSEKGSAYAQSSVDIVWSSDEAKAKALEEYGLDEEIFNYYINALGYNISFSYNSTVTISYWRVLFGKEFGYNATAKIETAYYEVDSETGLMTFYATAEDRANGTPITDKESVFGAAITISEGYKTLTITTSNLYDGATLTFTCPLA